MTVHPNVLELGFWIFFSVGVWVAVFRGPAVIHLMSRYTEEDLHTHKDVENWLLQNSQWFFHTLWTCRVCQAFWTAALAALGFLCAQSLGWLSLPLFPILLLVSLPPVLWIQKHL